MSFFNTLPPQTSQLLSSVPALIEKTFPMPARFRGKLPSQIAELSRLLTGARGDRSLSYLSRPNFLAAYLRYFLPWNLYRLCLILSGLEKTFSPGQTIVDLGSGPLTLVLALWISKPNLRALPLEFYCIDRCAPALDAGKKLFAAIAGDSPWKIHLVKEDIDFRKAPVTQNKNSAAFVCAVNLFNEVYESIPHNNTESLRRIASNAARFMHERALADASILTMEPGVPQSGRFISFLRDSFLELGRPPISPCPHTEDCPLSGGNKRWCHFAFVPKDAPKELLRLSSAAGIPKERLVFSFLLTGSVAKNADAAAKNSVSAKKHSGGEAKSEGEKVRLLSDAFALPGGRFGRYGCSSRGLVLFAGEKTRVEKLDCGSLVTPIFAANEERDKKSGALIIEVKQ